jgi:hypothetical protein
VGVAASKLLGGRISNLLSVKLNQPAHSVRNVASRNAYRREWDKYERFYEDDILLGESRPGRKESEGELRREGGRHWIRESGGGNLSGFDWMAGGFCGCGPDLCRGEIFILTCIACC